MQLMLALGAASVLLVVSMYIRLVLGLCLQTNKHMLRFVIFLSMMYYHLGYCHRSRRVCTLRRDALDTIACVIVLHDKRSKLTRIRTSYERTRRCFCME
jgi:hypothetical protein